MKNFWVVADVSDHKYFLSASHWFTLVEKDEDNNNVKASVKTVAWRSDEIGLKRHPVSLFTRRDERKRQIIIASVSYQNLMLTCRLVYFGTTLTSEKRKNRCKSAAFIRFASEEAWFL